MSAWAQLAIDHLWRNALAAVPLAVLVGLVCRWARCRPSTRHTLWLLVLVWFIVPVALPEARLSRKTVAPVVRVNSVTPMRTAVSCPPSDEPSERRNCEAVSASPEISECAASSLDASDSLPTPPGTAARSMFAWPAWLATARDFGGRLSTLWSQMRRLEFDRVDADRRLACGDSRPEGSQVAQKCPQTSAQGSSCSTASAASTRRPDTDTRTEPVGAQRPKLTSALASTVQSVRAELHEWTEGLLAVRDAIGRLPALPSNGWLLGVFVVIAMGLVRLVAFSRHVRGAEPAPPEIARAVAQAARRIGLRRPPDAYMTSARVSPMVWCGRSTRLILPRALWSSLDETGRRAVLFHELAHLKRRDHWVRWIEIIVACIYWWHPVVWWVRRRLREEADLCCDAWVTWVLPRERRAYAEALLATTRFISEAQVAVPATGIGMATVRASRLARRLTMVMTESARPRISLAGVALACTLAIAGWLATPVRSCPPEEQTKATKAPKPPTPPVAATVARAPFVTRSDGRSDSSGETPSAVTIYSATPRAAPFIVTTPAPVAVPAPPDEPGARAGRGGRGDAGLAERLRRIEENNARLNERLERLSETLERLHGARNDQPGQGAGRPGLALPRLATPRRAARGGALSGQGIPAMPGVPGGSGVVARTYKLPKGKLEAFTKLMTRQDVPIIVRPMDDAIEINATEAQHAVIKAFIEMLNDKAEAKTYKLSEGKREALFGLMSRDDVPTRVQSTDDGISVQGNGAEQAIFESFVGLLNGSPENAGVTLAPSGGQTYAEIAAAADSLRAAVESEVAAKARSEGAKQRDKAEKEATKAHAAAEKAMRKHAEAGEKAREKEAGEHRHHELEAQLEALQREHDSIETRADEMDDKAEEAQDQAESKEGHEKEELQAKARELRNAAKQIRREVAKLEKRINDVEQALESATR